MNKVMVVEDDDDVRNLLYTLLSSSGFDVVAIDNGKGAVEFLLEHAVDVVLLDVMMPEMDGWETLRLIRMNEGTRHVPVIMVTVKDSRSDKLNAIKEGATDYITKPFNNDELIAVVKKAISHDSKEA